MSGTILENGTGSGLYRAEVTSKNKLMVYAVNETAEHAANHDDKAAYNLLFDVTPTGAGDVFLYLKNTNTKDIVVEGITLYAASAEGVEIYLGATGTPSGGTSATPANLYSGTNKTAAGTFQTGNDITGLSGGTKVTHLRKAGDSESTSFDFEADLIVPPQQTLYIAAVTGAINLVGHVSFYHIDGSN